MRICDASCKIFAEINVKLLISSKYLNIFDSSRWLTLADNVDEEWFNEPLLTTAQDEVVDEADELDEVEE